LTFVRAPGTGFALNEPACQASAFLVVDFVVCRYDNVRHPPVAQENSIVGGLAPEGPNGFGDHLRRIGTVEIDAETGASDALSRAETLLTSLLGKDGQALCYTRSLAVQCIRGLIGQRKTYYQNSCSLRTVYTSEVAILLKLHENLTQGFDPREDRPVVQEL
jgi:hypothetical protein